MSCHKAIVVITRRAHCFHGDIYIYIKFPQAMYRNLIVVEEEKQNNIYITDCRKKRIRKRRCAGAYK